MKLKSIFITVFMITTLGLKAQENENKSDLRKVMDKSDYLMIKKDYTREAGFSSGFGEYVNFYPMEIKDLKTGNVEKGAMVYMYIFYYTDANVKKKFYYEAYLDMNEVNDLINFIDKYVIPNLNQKTDNSKKKIQYVFRSKEITFTYLIWGSKRQIQIKLNFTDKLTDSYIFWTNTQVKKEGNLVEMLKQIQQ